MYHFDVPQEFQIYSPWVYLHHIEGLRPDLLIVDLSLARNSWYLDYLAKVIISYPLNT